MKAKTAIRLGVTLTLIALLFTQLDLSDLPRALAALKPLHIFTALGILLTVRLLMAARMVMVAREFDVKLGYANSVAMVFSSSLAGFVLPGGLGTDVVRGLQLSSLYKDPKFAAASVLVDRFLGVLSMLAVGALALQFVDLSFHWLLEVFVYASLAGGMAMILVGKPLIALLPIAFRTRPGLVGKTFGFIDQMLSALQRSKRLLSLLSLSLVIQCCRCLVFLFTFYAFDLSIPVATVFALVPVLFIIVIAPISMGGLGVREGLLAVLLVPQGYPLESVVLVGLASHLLELVASLPGAIYLLRGFHPLEEDNTQVNSN